MTEKNSWAQSHRSRRRLAFAWYETKGNGAERTKIYVRESPAVEDGYVLIDEKSVFEGSIEDVS